MNKFRLGVVAFGFAALTLAACGGNDHRSQASVPAPSTQASTPAALASGQPGFAEVFRNPGQFAPPPTPAWRGTSDTGSAGFGGDGSADGSGSTMMN